MAWDTGVHDNDTFLRDKKRGLYMDRLSLRDGNKTFGME